MAANYRTSKYRTTSLSERDKSGFYVYGNTVRQAETLPRKTKSPYSQQREQTKRTSSRVVKNRNRAMSISPAYAVISYGSGSLCGIDLRFILKSSVGGRKQIGKCYGNAGTTCRSDGGK